MIAEARRGYVLGRLKKWGFRFIECEGEFAGLMSAVESYVKRHYLEQGYEPNTIPAATSWFASCAAGPDGKERVYGVTGVRPIQGGIEVTDFYVNGSRMGTLAGYAAMEELRRWADDCGGRVLTMTPSSNTAMIDAYRKVFDTPQPLRTLDVYLYQGAK